MGSETRIELPYLHYRTHMHNDGSKSHIHQYLQYFFEYRDTELVNACQIRKIQSKYL